MNTLYRTKNLSLILTAMCAMSTEASANVCIDSAIACAADSVGVIAACAAMTATDGFLALACAGSVTGAAASCVKMVSICPKAGTGIAPAIAPTSTSLGLVDYFNATSRMIRLSCENFDSDLAHAIEYRTNDLGRLVYVKLHCTKSREEFGAGEPTIRNYRRINGIHAERSACNIGSWINGVQGTVDPATGYIASIASVCRDFKFQLPEAGYEIGNTKAHFPKSGAGCVQGEFMAGLLLYVDSRYDIRDLDKNYVRGIKILCKR